MLDKLLEFLKALVDRLGAKAFVGVLGISAEVALMYFQQEAAWDWRNLLAAQVLVAILTAWFFRARIQETKVKE